MLRSMTRGEIRKIYETIGSGKTYEEFLEDMIIDLELRINKAQTSLSSPTILKQHSKMCGKKEKKKRRI